MNVSWKGVGGRFIVVAFSVALAMLFVLLLRSVAVQITPPPGPESEPRPDVSTPEACTKEGGRWQNAHPKDKERMDVPQVCGAYCEGPLNVDRERTKQEHSSMQTSLFVFAIGGTIAVVGGLLTRSALAVAPGLMLGGIFSYFVAGTQLWMLAPGLGRVITLGTLFVILVGVGWYFFKDKKEIEK